MVRGLFRYVAFSVSWGASLSSWGASLSSWGASPVL